MHRIFIFLLSLFALVLLPWGTGAQSSSIATQRGLYDIELVPGTNHDDVIVIYNLDQNQPLAVHAELSLWDLEAESDEIQYVNAEPGFNAAKWFQLPRGSVAIDNSAPRFREDQRFSPFVTTDFIVEPDKRREVPFRIAAPEDAIPGTYLVVARFSTVAPPVEGVTFVPEINILFFIKVAHFSLEGGVETGYDAEIVTAFAKDEEESRRQGIAVAHAGVLDDAIKTVVAKIKNTGIYYFRADGRVLLKNWYGRVVKEVELPKRYLLPNRVRTVEIPIDPPEENPGFFRSIGRFFAENSYLGPYTATVFLNFPQATSAVEAGFTSASTLNSSFTVWIIPWKFWIPFLLIITGLVWLIRRGRGRFYAVWRALRGKE